MAINKTVVIERIEVFPPTSDDVNTNAGHESLHVVRTITFTGTGQNASDVDLPMKDTNSRMLYYYSDEANGTRTSVVGEDALVQTVANAVWS